MSKEAKGLDSDGGWKARGLLMKSGPQNHRGSGDTHRHTHVHERMKDSTGACFRTGPHAHDDSFPETCRDKVVTHTHTHTGRRPRVCVEVRLRFISG